MVHSATSGSVPPTAGANRYSRFASGKRATRLRVPRLAPQEVGFHMASPLCGRNDGFHRRVCSAWKPDRQTDTRNSPPSANAWPRKPRWSITGPSSWRWPARGGGLPRLRRERKRNRPADKSGGACGRPLVVFHAREAVVALARFSQAKPDLRHLDQDSTCLIAFVRARNLQAFLRKAAILFRLAHAGPIPTVATQRATAAACSRR